MRLLNIVMCAETSKLQDFNSNYDSLLIATIVMFAVLLAVDAFVLVLYNIYICRNNPQGKILKIKIKYGRCVEIVGV